MTAQPDLSLIIRIEKLLAQAADPGCTEEERDAFQQKAGALIERHRIDRSLIGGHLAADDKVVTLVVGKFDGVYGRVRIELTDAVARNFDCKLFWSGYQNNRTLKVYGFKSDAELVIALANRLLSDADLRVRHVEVDPHDISMYAPDGSLYKSEKGAVMAARLAERRGFYLGYARAVSTRLRAGQEDAQRVAKAEGVDTHSAALVLVDRKRQVNDQFRSQVKTRSAGGINGGGYAGHDAGRAAGSQVSLAHQNQVGSTKALPR